MMLKAAFSHTNIIYFVFDAIQQRFSSDSEMIIQ